MRRVGTFIFGRPRPLSGDRRADPNYTLDPEEPEMLHLPDGARARERNTRLASPDVFNRHLDWIHSFRADEQVPEAPAVGG